MSHPLPRLVILPAIAGAIAFAGAFLPLPQARADGERYAPISDAVTAKECAACHMAFPAGLLPARSWTAVMEGLADHFGENATLDAETTKRITAHLVANAADARPGKQKPLRGLATGATPLRISELPWWKREHDKEVSPKAFADPKVGSKANCVACHPGAAKGWFEDD